MNVINWLKTNQDWPDVSILKQIHGLTQKDMETIKTIYLTHKRITFTKSQLFQQEQENAKQLIAFQESIQSISEVMLIHVDLLQQLSSEQDLFGVQETGVDALSEMHEEEKQATLFDRFQSQIDLIGRKLSRSSLSNYIPNNSLQVQKPDQDEPDIDVSFQAIRHEDLLGRSTFVDNNRIATEFAPKSTLGSEMSRKKSNNLSKLVSASLKFSGSQVAKVYFD